MARKYAATVTFRNQHPEAVLDCFADVLAREWHAKDVRRAPGLASARNPMSAFSWGEFLTINVAHADPQSVTVTVRSELAVPLSPVDWGKNKRNVRQLVARVGMLLAPPGTPPQQVRM